MRVLKIHNKYIIHGGEDASVDAEVVLLRKSGNEVIEYYRDNDETKQYRPVRKALLYFAATWSRKSYEDIKELCRRHKPDIAHIHNTLPLISPSAYYACKEEGVPVIQTLHNFRLLCPGGLLMRDGKVCEECVGGDLRPALKHRCYRNSYIQTRAIVRMLKKHRKWETYDKMIDRYIAPTRFSLEKFIQGGFPADKIVVKPNFLLEPPHPDYNGDYAIYLGRLSPEKGLHILIRAWKSLQFFPLKIVGDGPLRPHLQTSAPSNVEFVGETQQNEALQILLNSRFLVFPSVCYETFGRALIEAFACGKPVVASRLGAAAEIVQDGKTGLLFEPRSPEDLAKKAKRLINDPELTTKLGRNARADFEEKYTAEKNYKQLLNIYNSVINQPHVG